MPRAGIEAQLELILASCQFSKSERMCRFLRFVVEHSLDRGSDVIKEYTIGLEVFDKAPSFDPRTDTNVRTEARRLRAKLAEYYDTTGQRDGVRITLPKGSYTAVFQAAEPLGPVPFAGTTTASCRPWVQLMLSTSHATDSLSVADFAKTNRNRPASTRGQSPPSEIQNCVRIFDSPHYTSRAAIADG